MGSKTKADLRKEKFALKFWETMDGRKAGLFAGVKDGPGLDVTVSRLLSDPKVQSIIRGLKEKQEKRTNITKDRVLAELAIVAFADMKDYVTIGDQGQVQLISFDDERMPEGASRAVQKVKEKRSIRQTPGESGDMIVDLSLEYGHHSKIDALREISKLNGYYPAEKQEVSHSGTVSHVVEVIDYGKTVRPKGGTNDPGKN